VEKEEMPYRNKSEHLDVLSDKSQPRVVVVVTRRRSTASILAARKQQERNQKLERTFQNLRKWDESEFYTFIEIRYLFQLWLYCRAFILE